jgi:hypothetical protein
MDVGKYSKIYRNKLKITFLRLLLFNLDFDCIASETNEAVEAKLFGILVLISSMFIFNTKEDVDENGLKELSASHLSDLLSGVYKN